jgi:Protein of unknown function (DUF3999)
MPKSIFLIACSAILLPICTLNSHALAPNKATTVVKLSDFAYTAPLTFEGQDALYQTTLPLSVYQHTVRGDLGDLRVFNAQGEIVPHRLSLPARSNSGQTAYASLPFFPLLGPVNSLKQNISGTLINIGSTGKSATPAVLSAYIIDASALKLAVQALELEWEDSKENFVGSLTIDSSDDLKHWITVVRHAPLAKMQFGGHTLQQKRVEFPALRGKYLRLSWPADQRPLKLSSLRTELSSARVEAMPNWQIAQASAVADKVGEYEFDLAAHLPLQKVRMLLPQRNTLVQAVLFSRARREDSWQPVSNSVIYRLQQQGQDLHSEDITVANNHRYWLLRVAQNNGGLGSGIPEMQAAWLAHQLHFVTRGTAPFQLAYGSSGVNPAEFQFQSFLAAGTAEQADIHIPVAHTGAQQILGGTDKLQARAPELPWQKISLWIILGIAVLLLGWMAYRLLKQMNTQT